nr:MAG TPA: hypothetical protein [Crassvirales sp.]
MVAGIFCSLKHKSSMWKLLEIVAYFNQKCSLFAAHLLKS